MDSFQILIAGPNNIDTLESGLKARRLEPFTVDRTPAQFDVAANLWLVTIKPVAEADVDRIAEALRRWSLQTPSTTGTLAWYERIPGPRAKREAAVEVVMDVLGRTTTMAEDLIDAITAAVREDLEYHPVQRRLD